MYADHSASQRYENIFKLGQTLLGIECQSSAYIFIQAKLNVDARFCDGISMFLQIPLSCGSFLSARTEEKNGAGQNYKAEEGEAEGIGTTGGGLDAQVAGQ